MLSEKNIIRERYHDAFRSALSKYRESIYPVDSKQSHTHSSTSLKVCVRKKPTISNGSLDVLTCANDEEIILHDLKLSMLSGRRVINHHRFVFDHIFNERMRNIECYNEAVAPIAHHCISGDLGACLLYGQTGSGKTFNMTTLCEHLVYDVFSNVTHHSVAISFIEVCGTKCYDLLNSFQPVELVNAKDNSIHAFPVVEPVVNSPEELLAFIKYGCAVRQLSSNSTFDASANSHSLLRVYFQDVRDGETEGYLSVIDLAGLEHNINRKDVKEWTKESRSLQSLIALMTCMREGIIHSSDGNYRRSKLTMLLRGTFQSPCSKTCVFLTVSSDSKDTETTLHVLQNAVAHCSTDESIAVRHTVQEEVLQDEERGMGMGMGMAHSRQHQRCKGRMAHDEGGDCDDVIPESDYSGAFKSDFDFTVIQEVTKNDKKRSAFRRAGETQARAEVPAQILGKLEYSRSQLDSNERQRRRLFIMKSSAKWDSAGYPEYIQCDQTNLDFDRHNKAQKLANKIRKLELQNSKIQKKLAEALSKSRKLHRSDQEVLEKSLARCASEMSEHARQNLQLYGVEYDLSSAMKQDQDRIKAFQAISQFKKADTGERQNVYDMEKMRLESENKILFNMRKNAAILLQRWVRMHIVLKRRLKRIRRVMKRLRATFLMWCFKRKFRKLLAKVVVIQSFFRRVIATRRVRRMWRSVPIIQGLWTKYKRCLVFNRVLRLVYMMYLAMVTSRREYERKRAHFAALVVQSRWRAHVKRMRNKNAALIQKKWRIANLKKLNRAATSNYVNMLMDSAGRKYFTKLKRDSMHQKNRKENEAMLATGKIQKAYRNSRSRKAMKALEAERPIADAIDDSFELSALLVIDRPPLDKVVGKWVSLSMISHNEDSEHDIMDEGMVESIVEAIVESESHSQDVNLRVLFAKPKGETEVRIIHYDDPLIIWMKLLSEPKIRNEIMTHVLPHTHLLEQNCVVIPTSESNILEISETLMSAADQNMATNFVQQDESQFIRDCDLNAVENEAENDILVKFSSIRWKSETNSVLQPGAYVIATVGEGKFHFRSDLFVDKDDDVDVQPIAIEMPANLIELRSKRLVTSVFNSSSLKDTMVGVGDAALAPDVSFADFDLEQVTSLSIFSLNASNTLEGTLTLTFVVSDINAIDEVILVKEPSLIVHDDIDQDQYRDIHSIEEVRSTAEEQQQEEEEEVKDDKFLPLKEEEKQQLVVDISPRQLRSLESFDFTSSPVKNEPQSDQVLICFSSATLSNFKGMSMLDRLDPYLVLKVDELKMKIQTPPIYNCGPKASWNIAHTNLTRDCEFATNLDDLRSMRLVASLFDANVVADKNVGSAVEPLSRSVVFLEYDAEQIMSIDLRDNGGEVVGHLNVHFRIRKISDSFIFRRGNSWEADTHYNLKDDDNICVTFKKIKLTELQHRHLDKCDPYIKLNFLSMQWNITTPYVKDCDSEAFWNLDDFNVSDAKAITAPLSRFKNMVLEATVLDSNVVRDETIGTGQTSLCHVDTKSLIFNTDLTVVIEAVDSQGKVAGLVEVEYFLVKTIRAEESSGIRRRGSGSCRNFSQVQLSVKSISCTYDPPSSSASFLEQRFDKVDMFLTVKFGDVLSTKIPTKQNSGHQCLWGDSDLEGTTLKEFVVSRSDMMSSKIVFELFDANQVLADQQLGKGAGNLMTLLDIDGEKGPSTQDVEILLWDDLDRKCGVVKLTIGVDVAAAEKMRLHQVLISKLAGKNLKDKNLISKMNPYAVLVLMKTSFRTPVLHRAGNCPVWENINLRQTMTTNQLMKESVFVEVFDQNIMLDTFIGHGELSLASCVKEATDNGKEDIVVEVELEKKERVVGVVEVTLKVMFA